jgi:nitronate monooxygenase
VFHDVTNVIHAKRALQAGVDGLILVCAGARGHAGRLSPFALIPEVRQFYDGCLLLSGSIANGASILAAQALGADLAYLGTRFIAAREANATDARAHFVTVSSVRVVISLPKVRSSRVMNTGPLSLGK